MTRSPKKYFQNPNLNVQNRGVEAKEDKLGHGASDMSDCLKLNIGTPSDAGGSHTLDDLSAISNSTSNVVSQDSTSYIQVVVKKHQGKREEQRREHFAREVMNVASQTSPMRSSRVNNSFRSKPGFGETVVQKTVPEGGVAVGGGGGGSGEAPTLYVVPHHMFLASYPQSMPQACQSRVIVDAANSARNSTEFKKIIQKDFQQKDSQEEAASKTAIMSSASKQWLQDTVNTFKMGSFKLPDLGPDKVEVYLLDRGHREYYATTDRAPLTVADALVARADSLATRLWAELFGLPHLALAFVTAFLVQLLRSLLSGAVRPLLVGTTQTASDYLLKPLLAVLFNAVLQPPLTLAHNVAASARDALAPLAAIAGDFLRPLVDIVASFRPVGCVKCAHV